MIKSKTFSKFRKIAIGSTIHLAESIYLTTYDNYKQPESVLNAVAMLKWQMEITITSTLEANEHTAVYTTRLKNSERFTPDDFRNLLIDSDLYMNHLLQAYLDFDLKYGVAPLKISHKEFIKILN